MEINLRDRENSVVDGSVATFVSHEQGHDNSDGGDSSKVLKKIIRWLVYAAALITPLWFLPFTADTTEFNKQVLLILVSGLGLVLYLVDVIKNGVFRYKKSSLYLPIIGLVLASLMSVFFSVSKSTSLFGLANSRSSSFISFVSFAVLFFMGVSVIEDRGRELRRVMTVSLFLAFLFGTFQLFGLFLFKGVLNARAFNTVGTLNALGVLAAVALAFLSRGTEDVNSKLGLAFKIVRYLGLALAIFLVAFINWWPIWTIAFISLIASVAFSVAGDSSLVKKGRMRLFAMPMAIIVFGIFLMLIHFNWTSVKSKLPLEVSPSQNASWVLAWNSLRSRPLGFGAENFVIAYDKFRPSAIANSSFYQLRFSDGVSEFINMIVEGGVLMVLAFLAFLWFYGRNLVKTVMSGNVDGDKSVNSSSNWAASLGILAAIFLYSFNLSLFTFLVLLLVLITLSEPSSENEKVINLESSAKYSFAGSVGFIVGLVLVLVAGYFTVNNYVANVYLAKAINDKDISKALTYFVDSSNSNAQDARVYRLLSQTILTQISNDLKSGPKKDETKDSYNSRMQSQIASAVNVAIRATAVDPADSQNWLNRGLIYQNLISLISGADQAAVNSFGEAISRDPKDPSLYFSVGNVYLTLADALQRAINSAGATDVTAARQKLKEYLSKSEDNFGKAISLYNNFGQALYNLAVVYDREGKLPEAIKQFEKLQAANSRDPSIVFQLGLLYYRNNQKDNALRAWQQAVFLFPNYSNARWYLSLIYEERGDLANALEQVQEIQKLNPDNDLVKQRMSQLASGKRLIPPDRLLDKKPLNQ